MMSLESNVERKIYMCRTAHANGKNQIQHTRAMTRVEKTVLSNAVPGALAFAAGIRN